MQFDKKIMSFVELIRMIVFDGELSIFYNYHIQEYVGKWISMGTVEQIHGV